MKKLYNDRKVDKMKLEKSKQYLWRHIQKKKKLGAFAKEAKKSKGNFFASLFAPKKIAWASVIAVLTIIAVVVGPNLQNLLNGGIGTVPNIAYASFEMTPSNQDSAGIENDTTFELTSTEDLDASVVEANLRSTPETDLNVSKTAEGQYQVAAAQPLDANTVYTFSIVSTHEDGPKEFSWAYQVKDEFKITGTLPGDKTSGVPATTGIEINFSHEQFDLEEAKNYVTVSPAVEGYFEQHQRKLVFVPLGGLNLETIYTVTVEKGLPLEGSEKTLEEGKVFQFETANAKRTYSTFHFNRNYYEVGTDQPIALKGYLSNYDGDLENEEVTADTNIYKFANQEEYLDVVTQKNNLPTWASSARSNFKVDETKLSKVAEVEGQIGKVQWQSYIYLPDLDLSPGYYLVQVDIEGHLTQALLQVTDLSTYVTVTKKDSLVWVNDVKTDSPVANAKVKIIETGETATTNNEGIAKFNLTPEEHGYYNLLITSSDGKSLVTELSVSSAEINSSDYWSLINTDRPVYLPNDKVQFWGFLKPRTDGLKQAKDLTMKFTRGWGGSFVENVDFEMESDTTFSGSVDLNDVPPGYYNLSLYDGDTYLMQQSIQIQTYKKPTYAINVEADKNAYYQGETIHYDIETKFFDGTPMPNLKLAYKDTTVLNGGQQIAVTTDEEGKASVEEKAAFIYGCNDSRCYDVTTNSLTIRPIIGEDSDIYGEDSVRVFRSHLNLDARTDTEGDSAIVNISAHWIDLDKLNNETNTSYNDYLSEVAKERSVQGVITEKYYEKIESGEHYDFIEKRTVKEYKYEARSNPFGNFTVETDSKGNAQYAFEMSPDKYYEVRLVSPDNDGNDAHDTAYAYNTGGRENNYYRTEIINSDQDDGYNKFSINDTVKAALTTNDTPVKDLKGGKVLFLQYNNGLLDHSVEDTPYYEFIFGSKHVPGVNVNSVWFDGEAYQVGFGDYARLDTTDKELQVKVDVDKDSYEPGEKVNVSIEVLDKNGKPVQAEVNLNLVDEAYYKAVYDNVINPMSKVYTSSYDGVLSVYKSHDNPEMMTAGDMGGCFTAGTQILMSDGTYKAIEDIREGNIIRTKRSPFSNKMVAANVTGTVEHLVTQYMVVNENLEVTGEHVLLINGKWDVAESLKIGDTLMGKDGEDVKVTTIKTVNEPVYVYNFEVEKYHTYIAGDIYVHNDKGGDGVRNDFEDTALFQTVTTGGNGKASLEFQIPDNITTWRVTATAIDTDEIQVGSGSGAVKVTLPLFGDFVMNTEYSVKDSPEIGIRAFGEALSTDDDVSFKLTAKSLGLEDPRDVDGKAYVAGYEALPDLIKGPHTIQLDVDANGKKDALSEDILVTGSRLNKSVVEIISTVESGDDIPLPDSGYAEVYLMDAGVSSYYGALTNLYYSHGERFEKRLGEQAAIELLSEYFDQDFTSHYDTELIEYQRTDGGLSILPYASSDLELSALTVAFDNNPERYSDSDLKVYFERFYLNKDSNLEEITLSLLGLASLHEPVLTSLQTIQDEEKLSVLDKFYIGLAFERLGSKADAVKMYNRAISEMNEESVHENALATVLAASLQYKDEAVEHWENALFYADEDDLLSLYLLGYVKEGIQYASDKNVSFNVRVGNLDENKTLKKCQVFSALVSSMKGIQINDIEGDLAAVVFYEQAVEPGEFDKDERLSITRKYEIVGDPERTEMKVDDIVRITLNFSVGEAIPDKSYHVVDILPSGLQILGKSRGFAPYTYGGGNHPYRIHNQETHFGYFPSVYSTPTRTYYAKVIHPGEFYADPAKIEVFENPEIANISAAKTLSIK